MINSKVETFRILNLLVASTRRQGRALALRAYFDESGQSTDRNLDGIVVVAGCLAKAEEWAELENMWGETLREFGVSCFHATDLAHSYREFKEWRGKAAMRDAFMKALVSCMKKHVSVLIGAAVPMLSFAKFYQSKPALIDDPYHYCFHYCLEKASFHTQALTDNEKVHVIFARIDKLMGRSEVIHSDFQENHMLGKAMGPITLSLTPKDSMALQAADLFAYEIACLLKDYENKRPLRRSLESLLEIEHDVWPLGMEILREKAKILPPGRQ